MSDWNSSLGAGPFVAVACRTEDDGAGTLPGAATPGDATSLEMEGTPAAPNPAAPAAVCAPGGVAVEGTAGETVVCEPAGGGVVGPGMAVAGAALGPLAAEAKPGTDPNGLAVAAEASGLPLRAERPEDVDGVEKYPRRFCTGREPVPELSLAATPPGPPK